MSKFLDASSYNRLYPVEIANRMFTNRDEILNKLGDVLQKYGNNKFGVCIVHRHCVLEDGEKMVATGNVSQPEKDGTAYPERWLVTGEAYEFTREKTISPSEELLHNFQKIVGNVQVLGLFYIPEKEIEGVMLERTEGRRNITTTVPYDTPRKAITTAWHPKSVTEAAKGSNQSLGPRTSTVLYECSACTVSNGTHMENANKMTELERRTDLGLEIGGMGSDVSQSGFVYAL